ncbi:unnamed protein product [Spodoptera littoralis]|uniref:Uncharacterized protein n=1 Tax=Spodoptera littoralis TaxID=7109 RepID=A0A9P0I5R5_SPOLI|nr:unnamed protein product [Spodoptera littoralis]CAH1640727.1 unnamed protein product [Spodoptera littoralis]
MISGGWVCALHVRTAGLGGAALGSDEEEIVYLAYVVIDVLTNQVSEQKHVKTALNHPLTPPTSKLVIHLVTTAKRLIEMSMSVNKYNLLSVGAA